MSRPDDPEKLAQQADAWEQAHASSPTELGPYTMTPESAEELDIMLDEQHKVTAKELGMPVPQPNDPRYLDARARQAAREGPIDLQAHDHHCQWYRNGVPPDFEERMRPLFDRLCAGEGPVKLLLFSTSTVWIYQMLDHLLFEFMDAENNAIRGVNPVSIEEIADVVRIASRNAGLPRNAVPVQDAAIPKQQAVQMAAEFLGHTTVFDEAEKLVNGDRRAAYGHPLDNHDCTADLWGRWLERRFRLKPGTLELTPEDVCDLNVLQKLSRDAQQPKRDTDVDICGFIRNKEMIRDERERRAKEAAE